jgi:hypothetical protein
MIRNTEAAMDLDSLLNRLGDTAAMMIQLCAGNRHPTRHLTRKVARYYRRFRETSPGKPESFIVNLVAVARLTDLSLLRPQTKGRCRALMKELKDQPESDLKRVAVSILCIEYDLDERYRSDGIDRIKRNVDRELSGVQL